MAALALVCASCQTSVDSLGYDEVSEPLPPSLRPIHGPATYPNPLGDDLGITDAAINSRLEAAFQRLFHGDPSTEAIYVPVGNDQAYIRDVLHGDIRTEGIGYGMMIAVQLDHREEFDRLWTYARAELEYGPGPNRGYFSSSCNAGSGSVSCIDPFGQQQFAMSLIFAHDRWGSDTGPIDYEAATLELFDVMRNKEEENGGVVDGVTNMFDDATGLVFDVPDVSAAGITRPSIEMPGYYELWAQATGDPFWVDAAQVGRELLRASADGTTGLLPTRAEFDGTPVAGSDTFGHECYRAQLNMVLDRIWFGSDPWEVEESDRLLAFFLGQGIDTYGGIFTLDGTTVDPMREVGLVMANGATAVIATADERIPFLQAAWGTTPPTGTPRYYAGIMHLLSILMMSGQYRVY